MDPERLTLREAIVHSNIVLCLCLATVLVSGIGIGIRIGRNQVVNEIKEIEEANRKAMNEAALENAKAKITALQFALKERPVETYEERMARAAKGIEMDMAKGKPYHYADTGSRVDRATGYVFEIVRDGALVMVTEGPLKQHDPIYVEGLGRSVEFGDHLAVDVRPDGTHAYKNMLGEAKTIQSFTMSKPSNLTIYR